MPLTCSVVVCTRDRPHSLDECLAAISAGTRSANEVIVIDSAPKHTRAEQIAARWGARYIYESRPGVSRARNRAARESKSDIVAFVDDDAVPEGDWLGPLLTEFLDPAVALVGGKVMPPEADLNLLPTYAWFGIVDHGTERQVIDRSVPNWFELTNFASFVIGANMAIRRAVFDNWDGFDHRLGPGALIPRNEESKAFFELVDCRYRVVYVPRSVVRHAFPRSQKQIRPRALRAIEASVAYMALLLWEQPTHRKETWRYIRNKTKRLENLYTRASARQVLVPPHRVMLARLKGISLYFAIRLFGSRE
jgi:glycosyltransferase involved in cell wall biosynthesis